LVGRAAAHRGRGDRGDGGGDPHAGLCGGERARGPGHARSRRRGRAHDRGDRSWTRRGAGMGQSHRRVDRRPADAAPTRDRSDGRIDERAAMIGFFAPILIHATVLVLHLVVPAQRVSGYLRDASTGEPLRYRLNGLPVLAIVLLAWWFAGARGLVRWDWLWL